MRTAKKNPALSILAHSIGALEFNPTPVLRLEPRRMHYEVGGKWHVRMSLGGEQLTLGVMSDPEKAARFADAVLLFFGAFRKSGIGAEDSEFNYTRQQAAIDIFGTGGATPVRDLLDVLTMIKKNLIESGKISEKIVSVPDAGESWQAILARIEKKIDALTEKALKGEIIIVSKPATPVGHAFAALTADALSDMVIEETQPPKLSAAATRRLFSTKK